LSSEITDSSTDIFNFKVETDTSELVSRILVRDIQVLSSDLFTEIKDYPSEINSFVLSYKYKTLSVYEYNSNTSLWEEKTIGIWGLNSELDFDYLGSFQDKSVVRSSNYTPSGDITQIKFIYYPYFELNFNKDYPATQAALSAITGTDGIFETMIKGQDITSIKSLTDAYSYCNSIIADKGNPIITVSFQTYDIYYDSLFSLLSIDSDKYDIDVQALISQVTIQSIPVGDVLLTVSLISKLNGVEDYLKILLAKKNDTNLDDAVIDLVNTNYENVSALDYTKIKLRSSMIFNSGSFYDELG
jgi:hypothetical protein